MDTVPNLQANKRLERLLLLGLLLLAFGLRVYAIDASSLWSDEGNTWALMSRSFSQIAADSAADIHPPGYYWLLKIWSGFSGDSAAALRLFSAFTGVLIVLVVYRLGCSVSRYVHFSTPPPFLSSPSSSFSLYALLAALIAAVNPLQIFYSQEARMYMPLALAGSLLALALCQILRAERLGSQQANGSTLVARLAPYVLYVFSGLCGLWIHYSFPICLAAVGLTYLAHTLARKDFAPRLIAYVVANLLIIVGYLPWLRIGIERVINWPKGGESVSVAAALEMVARTFTVGPLRDRMGGPLGVDSAWLLAGGLLPLVGLLVLFLLERRSIAGTVDGLGRAKRPPLMTILLSAWLLLPLVMMFGFGLFSDAFLKFLLVAAAPWSLALAACPFGVRLMPGGGGKWLAPLLGLCMGIGVLVFSWQTLPTYYANPVARDNYAGIARYIDAVAMRTVDTSTDTGSARSLVMLNAPGQQEVWRYYGSMLPTLALPTQRPIDEAETTGLLAEKIPAFDQVFALFWATDEADPNSVVERWLDQHAYKGLDSWQGNVRFVRYDLPSDLRCRAPESLALFGAEIELVEFCLQGGGTSEAYAIHAGEALLIGLRWQTSSALESRYKVSLQLLDERNQVVAQRDSEPAGGSMPTVAWQPNSTVADNYGIVLPAGTPPGVYRLIVAMYNAETGQRLPTSTGDHLAASLVEVVRPVRPIPHEIVRMDARTDQQVGPVLLAGYDLHRKGYAHQPDTPVAAGDLVHVTLYWQAPPSLPADWPADLQFTMQLGNEQFSSSLVRAEYPTARWQGGEFVRGEFDILFDGSGGPLTLEVGGESIELHRLCAVAACR